MINKDDKKRKSNWKIEKKGNMRTIEIHMEVNHPTIA